MQMGKMNCDNFLEGRPIDLRFGAAVKAAKKIFASCNPAPGYRNTTQSHVLLF